MIGHAIRNIANLTLTFFAHKHGVSRSESAIGFVIGRALFQDFIIERILKGAPAGHIHQHIERIGIL